MGERLYRLLLHAYPRAFRRCYELDLLEAFRAQRTEPAYAGRWGALPFWRDILWDLARSAVDARRASPGAAGRRTNVETGRLANRVEPAEGWVWRGEAGVDTMRQDLGFAVRSLARAPLFTLVSGLTLAVGIGSTAAIFGVVRSVLLEPLPYGDPDGLVTVWSTYDGGPKSWVSEAEYRTYLTGTGNVFVDAATWFDTEVGFTDPESPERVTGALTSENLVDVLGVDMALGRFFTRDDAMRADTLPGDVIVVSHTAWMRRWSGDPAVVGSSSEVNGRSREIIGVLPEGFRLPTEFGAAEVADVYFPLYVDRSPVTDYPVAGGSHGNYVVARLRVARTLAEARSAVESAIARVEADFGAYPAEERFAPRVLGVTDDVVGSLRPALLALLGTVAFVLLIACANVANLMLARSEGRADELAVRAALGAGRGRLVRQLLVEALVLALGAGVLGVGLAVAAVDALEALNPGNLPRVDSVAVDRSVLAFAAAVSLATVLLFGALPALRGAGIGLRARMRGRSEGGGAARDRWRGGLVAAETALAIVLVVGAGLMARTFTELTSIEPGFDGESTLTAAISLPTTRYPDPDAAIALHRELLRRVEELPGVRSVGGVRVLPLGSEIGDWGLDIEGYDESVNPRAAGDWQFAAPGYFETIGIPLLEGRDFTWADDASSRPVGIVNEALVRRYFGATQPLGRTFVMRGTTVTVVGVAGDVRHNGLLGEIAPKFYIPVAQWGAVTRGIPTALRLVVRTDDAPRALIEPVRAVVRDLDPSLAVAEVRTVEDVLYATVAQPRFMVVVMGTFSAIALLLALVGVYGVIAYGVGRRTQEIGLRIALGARQAEVVGLMVRRGARMIGLGLALGVVLALLLGRYLESLLYGVTATDPVTFAVVIAGFGAVGWFATWMPSRRAARVDPIRALNSE